MGIYRRLLGRKGSETESREVRFEVIDSNTERAPAIWCVGGGKGGVGKSFVAANMGVLLAASGRKVMMVDADLGAANLHTLLGVDGAKVSLSSFLKGDVGNLSQLVVKTPYHDMELVSGAKDSLDVADMSPARLNRLRTALRGLPHDYVIVDVGPGTSAAMLDTFLIADAGIIVTTSDPTSIENTYRYLKSVFLRRIKNAINTGRDPQLRVILQKVFSGNWSARISTVAEILSRLRAMDPGRGAALERLMGDMRISILLNQSRGADDRFIGASMQKACHDYFGVEIGYLGDVHFDDNVLKSIRARKPLAAHCTGAPAAVDLSGCLSSLLGPPRLAEPMHMAGRQI